MAPTATEVKEVFDTSLSDSQIDTWINIAGDRLSPLDLSSLSTAEQDRLHIMLAAHYAAAQDPRYTQVSGNARSVSLDRTEYGTIAMRLDPTNSLGATRDSSRHTSQTNQ